MTTASQRLAQEMLARFPISITPMPDNSVAGDTPFQVGVPEFKVSINKIASETEMGRYDARIHLTSKVLLTGFKGGIYSRYLDEKGNVVWAILGDPYGVNPAGLSGDDITKDEVRYIPLDVLSAVHSVEVIRERMEDDSLATLKDTVEKLAAGAKIVREGLQEIGANVGEIAAAIKAT